MPISKEQMFGLPFEQGETSSPLTQVSVKTLRSMQLASFSKYHADVVSAEKKIKAVKSEIERLTVARNNALFLANHSNYTRRHLLKHKKFIRLQEDIVSAQEVANAHKMETRSKKKTASDLQKEINQLKRDLRGLERDKKTALKNLKSVDENAYASGHYAYVDMMADGATSPATTIEEKVSTCLVKEAKLIDEMSNPQLKSSERRKLQAELNRVFKVRMSLSRTLGDISKAKDSTL